ncbi:MAG TPA: LapA family protein [Candidatus Binatia bacterium]|nr:LapA family protein [Candidatus Binatia bacterium]
MLVILLTGLLLVLFATQNTEPVGVHLFRWEVSAPASVAVFVAFACGMVVGALLVWTDQRRARRRQQQPLPTPTTPAAAPAATPAKARKSWWW